MQELVKINDKHYIVDIRRKVPSDSDDRKPEVAPAESTTIQCCLFDLAQLWCETISVRNLIEREKKENSIIQYSCDIVNETILARKADDFNLQENIVDGNTLGLKLKYYVSGIPVTFNLCLNIASREELSENIMLPVWRNLLQLYEENSALKDLLIKKDIEIEQYKIEGAVLKRNLVATAKFDEHKFGANFPLSIPEDGLKVKELIKNKDRRASLMKLLKIKHRDPPEMPGSPTKLNKTSLTLTPTKRSPGGRAKGLEAIYAKQKMPKAATGSSISLKRLQADLSDEEDDKDAIEKMSNAGLDSSGVSDTGLKGKIRKITKL
ncbi:uncharacterized protein LOC120417713 isoform X1 [Culex pipiens pallens]|uniref:uncharacterized protein LOC120417713 isoform X1 n=1 Tax=Culex pipiens pallens TaxID=42434 RepID=UPI0022AB2AF2|nr:uncharacterized protein LOC120417713 isoform X1 [Culex pipiens pallens]